MLNVLFIQGLSSFMVIINAINLCKKIIVDDEYGNYSTSNEISKYRLYRKMYYGIKIIIV